LKIAVRCSFKIKTAVKVKKNRKTASLKPSNIKALTVKDAVYAVFLRKPGNKYISI